ncbi:MAG: GNAT family N-acetyltransferase [Bacteroidia bacterium]
MLIKNSIPEDLGIIFELFNSAINYQKAHGYELWPVFKKELIETEIREKRHWKIIEGDCITCIFSVMYNDPVIWGEKDKDPSVYLHRIAIHPAYKGRNSMHLIRNWAIDHARQHHKKYLRMDTWGNNENLRNYYIQCGFPYIGQQYLTHTEGLPAHYGGDVLSLFELKV